MVGIDSPEGYRTWTHEEANLAAERLNCALTVHEPGIWELATQRDASGFFAHVFSGPDCVRYRAAKAGVQVSWRRPFGPYVRDSHLCSVSGPQRKAVALHRSHERMRFP
jgi:hypothetical protein